MTDHLLKRLDSLAWYTRTDDLEERFTKKDSFGESYELFRLDEENNLIGLPRNYGDEGIAQTTGFTYGESYDWDNGFVPRDEEQQRLVDDTVMCLTTGKKGTILEAPTGYGKTYLGSAVIQKVGLTPCIITTKQDIMKDWRKALSEVLCIPESAVEFWHGDKVPSEDAQAVVALVQSVSKGPERYSKELYERFGVVLVDEVHRMGADEFSKAMWWFPARYRLGLSATPYRKDGREKVFTAHIGEVDVRTEAKALPFKVIMCDTYWEVPKVWQFDPEKKKNVFGPLNIPWGRAIMAVKHLQDDEYRNDIIAGFCRSALKKERHTVIFSDTVEHLTKIKEHLIAQGIEEDNFGYYVGISSDVYKRPKEERYTGYKEDIREQSALKPLVLATYKMCSEATNKPWWDTAVFATAKADVVQIMGRIRRDYPDKKTPTALDLCDRNHLVFNTFAKKRRKWYESENAEIVYR